MHLVYLLQLQHYLKNFLQTLVFNSYISPNGDVNMDKYKNVDVDKLANIYFKGNVISRNIFLKDGSRKTLGVMLPGKYEFNTESQELMEIISGKLNLKLLNDKEWTLIKDGMDFKIPKNSSFKVEVLKLVNYTCSYFED